MNLMNQIENEFNRILQDPRFIEGLNNSLNPIIDRLPRPTSAPAPEPTIPTTRPTPRPTTRPTPLSRTQPQIPSIQDERDFEIYKLTILNNIIQNYEENIRLYQNTVAQAIRQLNTSISFSYPYYFSYQFRPNQLTQEEIQHSTQIISYDETMNNTCPISLEEFQVGEQIMKINCGHIFKQSHLMRWLRRNHYCPICRYDLRQERTEQEEQREPEPESEVEPEPESEPEHDVGISQNDYNDLINDVNNMLNNMNVDMDIDVEFEIMNVD